MSAIARRLGLDLKTARKSIAEGLVAPTYAQRALRAMVIDQFAPHLSERVAALPEMSGRRSLWEIAGMGSPPRLNALEVLYCGRSGSVSAV